MKINRLEYNQNFALNVEKEREKLGLSQEKMAKALGISPSTYRHMVNAETVKVDYYMCYLGYKLTGKYLFEMVEYHDEYTDIIRKLKKINKKQLKAISHLLDTMIGDDE